ncbi:MAG: SipW-dependent-type signal peptide-containing protein [Actinomycetota bacterium]|nr:SipW-dependent-type signal peptide-containing protein [Actinomycetota bacterium]
MSRKVKAILAGGLVLGIGAAVTLAAWNDSEFVSGQFAAGTFNLEGSTTSATENFTDHSTAGTAAVVFDLSEYGNVSPEEVLYEPFWVRLAADTTSGATLNLAGVTAGDIADYPNNAHLSYAIYRLAAVDTLCNAAGVADDAVLIGSGTDLEDATAVAPSALAIGSPTTVAGEALNLCFVVTAADTLLQGGDASTTWEFEAVSN